MSIEEWKTIRTELDTIYSDFCFAYYKYKKGSNKKKRDEGERNAEYAVRKAKMLIENNYEVYELLTGGKDVSDFQRAITYDEFVQWHYFERDLTELIRKIDDLLTQ